MFVRVLNDKAEDGLSGFVLLALQQVVPLLALHEREWSGLHACGHGSGKQADKSCF